MKREPHSGALSVPRQIHGSQRVRIGATHEEAVAVKVQPEATRTPMYQTNN